MTALFAMVNLKSSWKSCDSHRHESIKTELRSFFVLRIIIVIENSFSKLHIQYLHLVIHDIIDDSFKWIVQH